MNATTCPKCSHGLGFNCVVCWPKAATVKMTATEYLETLAAERQCSMSARTPGMFVSTKRQSRDGNPVFDISADGLMLII